MLYHVILYQLSILIALSVADIATDNPNGNKTFLTNDVNILFINGKSAVINGLRELRNSSSWLVIFLVIFLTKFLNCLKT